LTKEGYSIRKKGENIDAFATSTKKGKRYSMPKWPVQGTGNFGDLKKRIRGEKGRKTHKHPKI